MSRTVTDHGMGHTLMAKTWNTDNTIRELLSFYKAPTSTSRGEVRRFYTFGDGLNAHPSLLHGGVIATILDSTLGNIIGQEFKERIKGPTYTAQLNVAYKKPVSTPGTITAQSWIKSVDDGGKKIWVEGVISSEVNGEVIIHAKAEGLWIVGKSKL
jgi:acyl-coenzyme A thioesterase PaaI-like protein